MPDLRSVVDAAERAAAAGDYVSAEQLLREVAQRQEASFGPLHPDLANTLNNLGVVCEFAGKSADAEHHFREAWRIAAAVLPPDHPFVATSRKNLEDFCRARGKAVDAPTAPPAVAVERDAREIDSANRQPEPSYAASRPVVSTRRPRSLAVGALIAAGLLALIATATWFRSNDEVEPGRPSASRPASPATAASPRIEPVPIDKPTEITPDSSASVDQGPGTRGTPSATPADQGVRESPSVPPAAAASRATSASSPQPPVMVGANLCRDLPTAGRSGESGDWRCVPPSLPVSPGPLFFYTRVKSPTDATVQHLWYRGDRLHQVVDLRILANTTSGYRTYSRNTVDSQGAGDWRVEVRTMAGDLLHEERFVVR